jgi:hypothetical protein
MERHAYHGRVRADQARDEREEIDLRHPFAEGPAAHDAGHPADYQRPGQAEAGLPRWRAQATQDPKRHTKRQAEAQQIGDEL